MQCLITSLESLVLTATFNWPACYFQLASLLYSNQIWILTVCTVPHCCVWTQNKLASGYTVRHNVACFVPECAAEDLSQCSLRHGSYLPAAWCTRALSLSDQLFSHKALQHHALVRLVWSTNMSFCCLYHLLRRLQLPVQPYLKLTGYLSWSLIFNQYAKLSGYYCHR